MECKFEIKKAEFLTPLSLKALNIVLNKLRPDLLRIEIHNPEVGNSKSLLILGFYFNKEISRYFREKLLRVRIPTY